MNTNDPISIKTVINVMSYCAVAALAMALVIVAALEVFI